ncbi:MAG TPA: PQQ-dependent sugar dehydrogenase [Vicinamibacterales bacterium]|nr:PQQ-dependent sugar dehydrogenase [Vicinamibacterales bacterium]
MNRAVVVSGVMAIALGVALLTAQQPAAAGQAAQGRGRGTPTAPPPIIWPSPPLADGPIVVDTALVRPIKITVTKGLNQPWGMAFLPDGRILVTERGGKLRIVKDGVLDPTPVEGLPPDIQAQGLAGLMDVQLHPKFAENKLVYITYHKKPAGAPAATPPAAGGRGGGPAGVITLARGRWDGTKLVDVKDIFSAVPSGNASRILFGRDGSLFMSVGYGDPPQANQGNPSPESMPPQDPMNLAGKTLRLRDDGTVPRDNPFVGKSGYRPEIYTLGHRNILGLAMNPENGAIWSVENGPNGGDEVNELLPGRNYGWPVIGNGRFYLGPRVSVNPYRESMEPPIAYWVPAIAPSGLTFYTGDKFPQWKNNLFVGGMRQGEVPRSGHLERFDFNEKWEELHREGMLRELQQRIRDVRQGPDGYLYLLTAENDGALMKIEPGQK